MAKTTAPGTWTEADFRSWREAMGWSQVEAGRQLGASERMLKNYEAGRWPVPRTVELAAHALRLRRSLRLPPA